MPTGQPPRQAFGNLESLNDTERTIVNVLADAKAFGDTALTGEEIAKAAGYTHLSSSLRATLSSLRKHKILDNKSPGYFLTHLGRQLARQISGQVSGST